MNPRLIIQIVLVAAVVVVGLLMVRSPGGARNQAARRLVTLTFVLVAVIAILTPSLMTSVAHLVGVGRGTDLLLYLLVLAFLTSLLSSFRRNAALERQLTRLARRVALNEVAGARPDRDGSASG